MARKIFLDSYLKNLAAKTPAPGGGSAAALAAALGAALVSMAAKYNLKNAEDKYIKKRIMAISDFSEKALHRLTSLMRRDEKAYLKLAGEIKKRRPGRLLSLYKAAGCVPAEVCYIAAETASLAAELSGYSRTSIISDIAEAAVLLESAFFSAKLNVEINLRGMKDAAYKSRAERRLTRAESTVINAKKTALKIARNFLSR